MEGKFLGLSAGVRARGVRARLFLFAALLLAGRQAFCLCSGVWPREAALIRQENPEILDWLGQRLIDPSHWKRGKETGEWPQGDSWTSPEPTFKNPSLPPYLGYGAEAFHRWKEAQLFVLDHCDQLPTLQDYQRIHSLVFYNSPGDLFWGYYSLQIWNKFPEAERERMNRLLHRAQSDPAALEELFRRGIKNGKGEFRSEGDTSWSGKPWSVPAKRYLRFDPEEFRRISRQPHLRIQVINRSSEGIEARFWHPPGREVPALLAGLFKSVESEAEALKAHRLQMGPESYRREAMFLASRFYLELVLIHGFWDGIGRSSKILRDWLLRNLGFQAPADTPENDLEYLPEEYARLLDAAVRVTEERVNRWQPTPAKPALPCEAPLQ